MIPKELQGLTNEQLFKKILESRDRFNELYPPQDPPPETDAPIFSVDDEEDVFARGERWRRQYQHRKVIEYHRGYEQ